MEEKEYDDWFNFGIRLRNARNRIGMTIEKLAEKSNRSENFIQRIENGKKRCSIDTLYQLTKALNITADELLTGNKLIPQEYKDKEIIENILDTCNEKQLKAIKEILIAVNQNFDKFDNSNNN